MEVLRRKLGFKDKRTLAVYASPTLRESPDPAAGILVPEDVSKEVPRGPESDPEFDEYVKEFQELVADLVEKRSAWEAIAPFDDPMRYDEVAFRQLESLILADLVKSGASSRLLRLAHCLALELQIRNPYRRRQTG